MKRRPLEWLSFGLALLGSAIATIVAVGLLNITGDCAPTLTDCGEPQRRVSFVVLTLGVVWIAYLIVRFIRSPKTFR